MRAASQTLEYFIYLDICFHPKLSWMLQLQQVVQNGKYPFSWIFCLKLTHWSMLHGSRMCMMLGHMSSLSLKHTAHPRGPLQHLSAEPTMVW